MFLVDTSCEPEIEKVFSDAYALAYNSFGNPIVSVPSCSDTSDVDIPGPYDHATVQTAQQHLADLYFMYSSRYFDSFIFQH